MTKFEAIQKTAEDLKHLLYRAVRELEYVRCAEDHSQCKSAEGEEIIELGMKVLGVKNLVPDKYPY